MNKNNNNYTKIGEGDCKVIALHDWMGNTTNWDSLHAIIDRQAFSFAFMDIRGYGKALDTEGSYNSQEIVNDIIQLADSLGWDSFNIIGHSMTAMPVVSMLNSAYESRLKSMMLIAPVGPQGFALDAENAQFFTSIIQSEQVAATAYAAFTGNSLGSNWYKSKAKNLLAHTSKKAMHGYLNMWSTENFMDRVKGHSKPIQILYGKQDHPGFGLASLEANFGHFPNTEFIGIDNAGHYPMLQVPIYTLHLIEHYFLNHNSQIS